MKYAEMLELWKSAPNLSVVLMLLWLIDHTNAKQFLFVFWHASGIIACNQDIQDLYLWEGESQNKICCFRLLTRSTIIPFSSCAPLPPDSCHIYAWHCDPWFDKCLALHWSHLKLEKMLDSQPEVYSIPNSPPLPPFPCQSCLVNLLITQSRYSGREGV